MSQSLPQYVTSCCEHCDGNIEFDANQLAESEACSVECPHCGVETIISRPKPPLSTSAEKQNLQIEGSIAYFRLTDWWLTEFTDDERQYIELKYKPLNARPLPLTTGKISKTTQTAVSLLSGLAGWFSKADEFFIGKRIIKKLIEIIDSTDSNILDLHFAYGQIMENYYRARDVDTSALEGAVWACEKQIAIAPEAVKAFQEGDFQGPKNPWHKGYEQLAIILEKQNNYAAAIRLCNQAKAQGWGGNWNRRIERCKQKLC